jgi:ketosteroid isomerase-like protein
MNAGRCRSAIFIVEVWVAAMGLIAALGCKTTRPTGYVAGAKEAQVSPIRKLDADWVKAAQSKQPDAWMAFYADDAVVLPPNEKIATTKEEIRKPVSDLLSLPGLSINWQPTKIEVARSGDLAYLYGAYQLSFNDPSGKMVSDAGKNVEIWKKQPDGSWKCILDTWNSDLPPTPAAQ